MLKQVGGGGQQQNSRYLSVMNGQNGIPTFSDHPVVNYLFTCSLFLLALFIIIIIRH